MKTAIYIEDGITQIVLTPENDFEKYVLSKNNNNDFDTKIFTGSFYDCRGGWISQSKHYQYNPQFGDDDREKSLIITSRKIEEDKSK
tara:strand:- start:496 stop:756 length:261 start_codon:yes stop_codon:yes gene_type:complete